MKPIVYFASLVIATFAATAAAQAPKEPAKEPAKEAVKPVAKKAVNPKRSEDARHCLEKPSNTEIIKCAEEFL